MVYRRYVSYVVSWRAYITELTLLEPWAAPALAELPDQVFGAGMTETTICAESSTDAQTPQPNSAGHAPSLSEVDVPVIPMLDKDDKEAGT